MLPTMPNRKRNQVLKAPIAGIKATKRRRNCLTIEDKISLLDRLKAGERPMDLSRDCDISESTIRTLMNCESSLRKYAEICSKNTYHSVAYMSQDKVMEKMEKHLYEWHSKQCSQGKELTQSVICAKAREMFGQLKIEDQQALNEKDRLQLDGREFKASRSWFMKFRKRYNLDYGTTNEDKILSSTTKTLYPAAFVKLIQSAGYQPHQVFTASEHLFKWKRLPWSTFIAKKDETLDKIGHEQISLLFCSNALGTFYVKPMLIHRSRYPHCLRGAKFNELPVFWRSRGQLTEGLPKVIPSHFHSWLTQCFIPAARNYLQIMEMPERCLLLLNSDFKRMVLPAYDDSFLRIEFIPKILEPITKSVIPVFECKYLKGFFANLQESMKAKQKVDLFKIWHKYSIADAIDIIHECLEDITMECWQSGWHRLWPEIGNETYFKSNIAEEINKVITNGRQLPGEGFVNMAMDDIMSYLRLNNNVLYQAQQEYEILTIQDKLENSNCLTTHAYEKLLAEVQNTNDELISSCSEKELQSEEDINGSKSGEKDDHSVNGNALSVDFIEDEEVSEFEVFEEEAIIEYHQTDDLSGDEMNVARKINAQTSNKKLNYQKHREVHSKLQIINKAIELKRELMVTLEQLGINENFTNFQNGLTTLMHPYIQLKTELLQPTIKDYFK